MKEFYIIVQAHGLQAIPKNDCNDYLVASVWLIVIIRIELGVHMWLLIRTSGHSAQGAMENPSNSAKNLGEICLVSPSKQQVLL